jgi:hypothetical protein
MHGLINAKDREIIQSEISSRDTELLYYPIRASLTPQIDMQIDV